MSVLIKNMEMPKGCIYANDNDQTEYCPLLNHDDVPFCQYIENEPESAIGIDERPVYCPLSDVSEPCQDTVSRQDAIELAMQYCPDDDGTCSKADEDIRNLLDELEDLPSAQPEIMKDELDNASTIEPERTGKWIKEKNRGQLYQCSACGNYLDFRGVNAGRGSANYCPNCGARMES